MPIQPYGDYYAKNTTPYSIPQVIIDLAEYNELKEIARKAHANSVTGSKEVISPEANEANIKKLLAMNEQTRIHNFQRANPFSDIAIIQLLGKEFIVQKI